MKTIEKILPEQTIKERTIKKYACEYCDKEYEHEFKANDCEYNCKQKQCKHKFRSMFFYDRYEKYGFGGYILDKVYGKCSKCDMYGPEFNISQENQDKIDRILDKELKKHLKG